MYIQGDRVYRNYATPLAKVVRDGQVMRLVSIQSGRLAGTVVRAGRAWRAALAGGVVRTVSDLEAALRFVLDPNPSY